ncbi:MAG TPA: tripartite tricarboxylate transporter substrate binding protein [Pseudolabrys sp.]|nr:tripartite tricarboxylate transporter substrate binding protein [Pseudolabrys sp.]
MSKIKTGFCLAAIALALAVQPAFAQGLTGKTVKIVVPYAAGGTGDVVARVLAQAVMQKTGQAIIVEDRPGASSIVGTEYAARATPDGTTVLLVENPFILSAIIFPGHYDALTAFEPLCYIAATPAVLAVSSKSDIQTLADFVALAKSKPGAVSYGSTGPASIAHIAGELLKRDAKAEITYVPYPGSPPAMNATLAGTITAVMANYSDLKGQIDSGALRPIAVPAKKRSVALPNVPTVAESGFNDVDAAVWFGFVVPAKTPKDVVAQLSQYILDAVTSPAVVDRLKSQGMFINLFCGADFGKFLAQEHRTYTQFTAEFNIKP